MVPPSGEIPPPAVVSPTTAQSPAESITTLIVRPPVIVREFAIALNLRPFRLISELMEMGIFASIGQSIEESIAVRIARKHGISLEIRHRGDNAQQPKTPEPKDYDNPAFLLPRPPVVCVLGHVDHGKTTLLDYYRKTSVVSGEAGGITQHVGAYSVKHKGADDKVQLITFLDTPGHAAFSKMRERGAEITDIAILVVAADDGFMPQTDEALKFAQKNNVQIVVAINKIDAKGANIDRIKQQMQQRNIASEDWGGTVLTSPISALKGDGMGELLDNILLQAEIMELKANPKRPAEGVIIEAQIETGRGPTAVLIVQKGTLKVGDAFVSGQHYCKVRALFDDHGNRLQSVSPGCPALTLGWSGAPTPGSVFQVCKNEREARVLAEENAFNLRKALEEESELERDRKTSSLIKLSDMDRLMAAIAQTKDKILKVVCKADVNGTLEALISCLEGIHSDKVRLEVIASSVGPVTPNDVNVAHAGGAIIVAFDVKQESGVTALLKRDGVRVISHNIIYMLIDIVKEEMAALLDPELRENKVGLAEVRAVFPHGKNGFVAGCMVTEGRIQRDYKARLHRKNQILYNGEIDTLKRFKDDATEVKAGYECGIRIGGFEDYQIGDSIECYEMLESRPTL
jgi:translation initiation factor IF-2